MSRTRTPALLLFAAACASTPAPEHEEVEDQSLPAQKETAQIPSAWESAAKSGGVPDGWVKSFGDPTLEALVAEAIRDNLALRGAAARVDAAAGFAKQAAAALKPTIGLGAGAGGLNLSEGGFAPAYSAGLQVAWEVDVWGRLRALADAGEERFKSAQADFEFARESLAAQTARVWYLCVEANMQLALARQSEEIFGRTLKFVEARKAQGRAVEQDVRMARSNLGSARERARAAEGARNQAVRSLEVLLGRYPAAELKVAEDLVPVPPAIPAGLPSEIMERRGDLVAAERRVRAAFKNVEAAKLTRLPQVQLTATGGVLDNQVLDLIGKGPSFFQAGANFFQPIYTGGAIEAAIEIQTAAQEAALAEYGMRALVAFGEVETALNNSALLKDRVALQTGVVADDAEAVRLARAQYEIGRIDLLSVLQLQQRELSDRSRLISLRNAGLAERISLHLALGGSFE